MKKQLIYIFNIFLNICFLETETILSSNKYDRKEWKHWVDQDKNSLNTRQEVLKRDSTIDVSIYKNRVIKGKWYDPYSGKIFYSPEKIDIEHLVPLKEAWSSGGANWDKIKKEKFANYLDNNYHLKAVDRRLNRQKGNKKPSQWLPENIEYRCEYLKNWIAIKKEWSLKIEKETYILKEKYCKKLNFQAK